MATINRHYAKVNVFEELQNLELRAIQLEQTRKEDTRHDQKLRDLKGKLEKLTAKRDDLRRQLKGGPKEVVAEALTTGRKMSADERSNLEATLQDAELKRVQELQSLYRLTGTSTDLVEKNVLRWRFDTSYKGEFFEPYYVEIKVDPNVPSSALHHTLPLFIPLDELMEHHLYHDVKGFVEAVHQYLIPFVMRREEVLKMERKFDDNIDTDISVSGSYDCISFTLVDVKYFEEPLDIRLVYDDLKDHAPSRISISPPEGSEVTSSGRQVIAQYTDLLSRRPLSEAVESIITGRMDLSGSSPPKN
ncbi:centromere protein O-like [Lineus longissimus]|uniref:centromere protein O-like n=1 Tax=Lineus longissimus TaxID=88925 RepID=UPI00315D1CA5